MPGLVSHSTNSACVAKEMCLYGVTLVLPLDDKMLVIPSYRFEGSAEAHFQLSYLLRPRTSTLQTWPTYTAAEMLPS